MKLKTCSFVMTTTRPKPKLRLDKEALFKRLAYAPHEGQLAVHRSTAKRRVLAAGCRWGKSTCGSMEAIAAVLQPCEKSLGWIVAPTFDTVDRTFEFVKETIVARLAHRIVDLNRERAGQPSESAELRSGESRRSPSCWLH